MQSNKSSVESPETSTREDDVPELPAYSVSTTDTLEEIERSLSVEMKEKFERRLKEGFDLDIDPLYTNWKQLKLGQAHSTPLRIASLSTAFGHASPPQRSPLSPKQVSNSTSKEVSPISKEVSPVLKQVLNKPKFKSTNKKRTTRTLHIPKHLSGEEFIEMMEAKEKQKQEEIEQKEARKREREEGTRSREVGKTRGSKEKKS